MVVKNMSLIFVVLVIATMGLTIYPVLADQPYFDKKAAAIEKYKAKLAAKEAKKTESIQTKAEETVSEIKEEISEKVEEVEAAIETKVSEIKDEATEKVVEEASTVDVDDEIKAATEHAIETLEEEVPKEEHLEPEHPHSEHPN